MKSFLIRLRIFLPTVFLSAFPLSATLAAEPPEAIDFAVEIEPLLATHCYQCHGPDEQEGGLRLDHRQTAFAGGDSGPAIVPGKMAESEIVRRIAAEDEDERMPPTWEESVKPLSEGEVALVRRWVRQGAPWPEEPKGEPEVTSDHWAFQPVVRRDPPAVKDEGWARNPIDRFVLARLEAEGIAPSPAADRYTLIKRLYYDLVGLPPEPEEVDAFVSDNSPDAYEKLVDRLLASPHFGERWGRHWLDKARYADSDGYEKDRPRPNAWRYRDWVIDAVNRDMPLDQFAVEQIAGDLLPEAGPMDRLATAFHRQTLTNTEGGTDQEEFRVEAVRDRVDTIGSVWLGLTVGCAKCHSHKYDPITQREYYQVFAFFDNGDEANMEVPTSDEAVAEYERKKAEHDRQTGEIESKLAERRKTLAATLPDWEAEIQAKLAAEDREPVAFRPLEVESVASQGGAKFERLEDGSWLAGGENPAKDTITVIAKSGLDGMTGFTGFRVEALADESLSSKGPGRTGHGNFVLSEMEVYAGAGEETEDKDRVKLAGAEADFSQQGWPVAAAIDGKLDTGWAISPQMGKDHHAVFTTDGALPADRAGHLKFVLRFEYGSQHVLGRFRITARTGSEPDDRLPGPVRKVLAVAPEKRDAKQRDALLDYYVSQDAAGANLSKQLESHKKSAPKRPTMKVRVIAERGNPRTTHVLRRGDFLSPQEEVQPAVFAVLHGLEPRRPDAGPDRLDFARWLVDAENPLTPRVAANQIWGYLFGEGIVRTMNDFGARGETPSHPELLDWLASELIQRRWSRKSMIRLIVTSAAYRQASRHRPDLAEKDPLNTLLYRQNRFRVEAEIVRDVHLAASGLLSRKIGGPSVFPPMPPDVAALSYSNNFKWNTSQGEDRYRRGMYTFFKRTSPHPNLNTFDCPDANTTCVERGRSNTPLQALTTLNNEVFVEASQAMARRVLTEEGLETDAERIDRAFRLCVARPPSAEERERLADLLETARTWYAEHPAEAEKMVTRHRPDGVPTEEAAAWVATARIVMNLDEFITRE